MLPMNKQVELYEMLMELLKAEEKCRNEVRDSQNEVNLHHMFSCIICSTFFKISRERKKNGWHASILHGEWQSDGMPCIHRIIDVNRQGFIFLVNMVSFPQIIPRLIIYTECLFFTWNNILKYFCRIHYWATRYIHSMRAPVLRIEWYQ